MASDNDYDHDDAWLKGNDNDNGHHHHHHHGEVEVAVAVATPEGPHSRNDFEANLGDTEDHDPYTPPPSNHGSSKRKLLVYGVIVLAVVGLAVGIAVGVTASESDQARANPAAAPTVWDDMTPGPTPTTANLVMDAIVSQARQGGEEFDDALSYQSRALTWVMTQTLPAPELSNLSMEEQAVQLYALACVYFSTYAARNAWTDFHFGSDAALPGWFTDRGWLVRAGGVCSWHGIVCDDNNRVASIELATNGLTGSFPSETALLASSLVNLDLFNNLLHNKGDEGNAFLGELVNLEYLFLGTTSFEYDGVPSHLGKLTKLQELDFSYSLYFGAIPAGMWSDMTELSYLVMSGNAYNSTLPADLIALPKLEYMYAAYSFLDGNFDFVSKMPKIFELWIDDNPGMGGSLPTSLTTADTLVSFSATNCGLTGTLPTELGLMTDMIQMWVYDNKLSGPIPSELGQLRKLRTLDLQKNDLSGAMPEAVCSRTGTFGRLKELEADCDGEIACPDGCCTCCGEDCIDPK